MVAADEDAIDKYRELSKRLADRSLLADLRLMFTRRHSVLELLDWMHDRLKFDKGNIERHNDPRKILAYGRGRCGEFSILFTSLCLAHNYRARLILDMTDHVWTEVWDTKTRRWVHIDPSEKKIDDPFMYERDWKKNPREVYAFENGNVEDVTKRYKIMKE